MRIAGLCIFLVRSAIVRDHFSEPLRAKAPGVKVADKNASSDTHGLTVSTDSRNSMNSLVQIVDINGTNHTDDGTGTNAAAQAASRESRFRATLAGRAHRLRELSSTASSRLQKKASELVAGLASRWDFGNMTFGGGELPQIAKWASGLPKVFVASMFGCILIVLLLSTSPRFGSACAFVLLFGKVPPKWMRSGNMNKAQSANKYKSTDRGQGTNTDAHTFDGDTGCTPDL